MAVWVTQLLQLLLVLALAPWLTGLTRTLKSRLLRRRGPSPLQPYRDLWKLLRKETVLAEQASWLFRAAPYVIFATTWVAAALVPTFATGLRFSAAADLIVIVALLGTARFSLALAGLDVGTSFGGIGASREMMFASLAEPAMLMVVFTLSLLAGSTQLSSVAAYLIGTHAGINISLALALIALIIVSLAENGRIPVDNPATHLELTMVHEAMVLEYAGPDLALATVGETMRLTLLLGIFVNLVAPWGVATSTGIGGTFVGLVALAVKVTVAGAALAVFEVSTAKVRLFRVPELLAGAFVLALLGVVSGLVVR